MTTKNEVSLFLDAMLSVPGMNEPVKIDLKISRRQILLLAKVIQQGLVASEGMAKELLSVLPKESVQEMNQIAIGFLEKAGLSELEGKLNAFIGK